MKLLETLRTESGRQSLRDRTLDRLFYWCEFVFLLLPVFGTIISTFAAIVWVVSTISFVWTEFASRILLGVAWDRSIPDFRSPILNSIELLLIVPLPGIVGRVVYQQFGRFMNRRNDPAQLDERELLVAKKLLLGSIVAVSATHMLDLVLTETGDIWKYVPGLALMTAIAVVMKLGFSDSRNEVSKSEAKPNDPRTPKAAPGKPGAKAIDAGRSKAKPPEAAAEDIS